MLTAKLDDRLRFSAVYLANITHISPWKVTCGILAGANAALAPEGLLVIYGPFKVKGEFTTESNKDFDTSLRQKTTRVSHVFTSANQFGRSRNAEWGYRDIDEVAAEAERVGLRLQSKREMPAKLS